MKNVIKTVRKTNIQLNSEVFCNTNNKICQLQANINGSIKGKDYKK